MVSGFAAIEFRIGLVFIQGGLKDSQSLSDVILMYLFDIIPQDPGRRGFVFRFEAQKHHAGGARDKI